MAWINSLILEGMSFFSLPKNERESKPWVERLNRKDALPKKVLICEDHFTHDCFDVSTELKIRFQEKGEEFFQYCSAN